MTDAGNKRPEWPRSFVHRRLLTGTQSATNTEIICQDIRANLPLADELFARPAGS
jgi:hypothetical protein